MQIDRISVMGTPTEVQAILDRLARELAAERATYEVLYAERDTNLRVLGFRDYGEYLNSDRFWLGGACQAL